MQVLILGGSGVLSYDFTKICLDVGYEVTIVNRGKRKHCIDPRARLITIDLRNNPIEKIKSIFADNTYDVIVDFLSYNQKQLEKSISIFRDNVKQYIFISSATVYLNCEKNNVYIESSVVGNKAWKYAYNKISAEAYIKSLDINFTIIRPYVTFSEFRIPFQIIPNGYYYTLLSRIIHEKPVVLVDGGIAVTTLTSTIDFGMILKKLLLNEKAYHEIFHITSGMEITWEDVYLDLCSILNKEPNLISVGIDDVKRYLPEYFSSIYGDKARNWRFDNTKVLDAIGGYEFQVSIHDGLKRSVEYFLNNSFSQGINYQWEGEIDYMIKSVSAIKKLKCLPNPGIEAKCNSKIRYYITAKPVLHEIFFKFRNRKLSEQVR